MPDEATVTVGRFGGAGAAREPRGHPRSTGTSTGSFEAAFRDEFAQRYPSLARYLARLTGDAEAAADLAQEAFVRLFGRGSMPDDVRAWLVSVAHNLLRNERQRLHRRRELLDEHEGELQPSGVAAPDAALEADDRRARVRAALDALPERERRMLLLRYEGFSYHEIGKALGIHDASVGTLLARAKQAFREALEDDGGPRASD